MTLKGLSFAITIMVAPVVQAASVVFEPIRMTAPSAEAVAAGTPAGWIVYKFYLSSDADILSINQVKVMLPHAGQSLFQVPPPFGSDVEPPDPAFVAINRALETDSWISTPGTTVQSGTALPGDGTGTWSDLTNDGPQQSFNFATLTVPSFLFFECRISVASTNGPEEVPFRLDFFPEPSTYLLSGIALAAFASCRLNRERATA